jgi:hypothetical protein
MDGVEEVGVLVMGEMMLRSGFDEMKRGFEETVLKRVFWIAQATRG